MVATTTPPMQMNHKTLIEAKWAKRAAINGWKTGTYMYRQAEVEFFAGAIAAIEVLYPGDGATLSTMVPPIWVINILSGRPVCQPE